MQQIGRREFGSLWTEDEGASASGETLSRSDAQYDAAKRERFTKITNLIVTGFANGALVCALRTEQGGEPFVPVKADVWNTEHYDEWIKACCMKQVKVDIFMGSSDTTRYWIFVGKKGLDQFLIPAEPTHPGLTNDIYLSPYMRLMVDVVKQFGIADDDQSKIELVQEYIDKQWPIRGLPESKKLRTSMATMVRDPAAQSGGLKKSNRKG
jgi:hypothetical protein